MKGVDEPPGRQATLAALAGFGYFRLAALERRLYLHFTPLLVPNTLLDLPREYFGRYPLSWIADCAALFVPIA